jgi:hypothetical protein
MTEAPAGHGLQAREPGASIPSVVLEVAASAGRRKQPADLRLLQRVLDGLRRLPGCSQAGECSPVVPGQCPPSSRWHLEER